MAVSLGLHIICVSLLHNGNGNTGCSMGDLRHGHGAHRCSPWRASVVAWGAGLHKAQHAAPVSGSSSCQSGACSGNDATAAHEVPAGYAVNLAWKLLGRLVMPPGQLLVRNPQGRTAANAVS